MKIRVNDLPEKGLHASETIEETAINARLQEAEGNQFIFTAPLACTVHISPLGALGAEVKGNVKTKYTQGCSLCLDNLPRELSHDFTFQLRKKNESELVEDDVGIFYFSGDHVELDQMIEEEIILTLSIFWHPEFMNEKCSSCSRTKASLGISEKTSGLSLGDLITAAAKKSLN